MKILNGTAQVIAERLSRHGEVYLVGGAVRDIIRCQSYNDYDFVTNLAGPQVKDLFQDKKCTSAGKSFEIVIVEGYEIATFRKIQGKAGNGLVSGMSDAAGQGQSLDGVAESIEEDLANRDFTVNAMAFRINTGGELSDTVIDPLGGLQDLQGKRIRFAGDPNKRISEDPVRMVRAARFAALINGYIDECSYSAIKTHAELLNNVPGERIRTEILKIMKLPVPSLAIEWLRKTGVLKVILPEIDICYGISQNKYHTHDVYTHSLMVMDALHHKQPLLRLAGLLHDAGKPQTKAPNAHGDYSFIGHELISADIAREILNRYCFSFEEIGYVSEVVKNHMFFMGSDTKDSTYRRFMSALKSPVRDIIRIRIADRKGKNVRGVPAEVKEMVRRVRKIEKEACALKVTDLAVTGIDVIETLNIAPGPKVGDILRALLNKVLDNPSLNTRESLIEVIKTIS